MDLSQTILGRSICTWLKERQAGIVLKIGRDTFTRAQLAHVECFHFVAAANLSKVLSKDLAVKDTRDVYEHVDPIQLALPHIGAVSLAVLGAAFEAKGLGSDAPLENWVKKHQEKIATFGTIKHHAEKQAHKDAAATSARRKRRS